MRFRWFLCVFVHCCVSLRVYECFCAFLRVFVPFGCSWSLLGRSWAFLEGSWGALGAILEQSWTLWVTLGTPLGRSWGAPGAMLDTSCKKCVPRVVGIIFWATNLGAKIVAKIIKNQC